MSSRDEYDFQVVENTLGDYCDEEFIGLLESRHPSGAKKFIGYFSEGQRRERQQLTYNESGGIEEISVWKNGWKRGIRLHFVAVGEISHGVEFYGEEGASNLDCLEYFWGNCGMNGVLETKDATWIRERLTKEAYDALSLSTFAVADLPTGQFLDVLQSPSTFTWNQTDLAKECETYLTRKRSPGKKVKKLQNGNSILHAYFNENGKVHGAVVVYWPSGFVRQISFYYEGMLISSRVTYRESGFFMMEEHFSFDGAASQSAVVVKYERNGTSMKQLSRYENNRLTKSQNQPIDHQEYFAFLREIEDGF